MLQGLKDVRLELVDSVEKVNEMMEWFHGLDPDTILGFDTETSGLEIFREGFRLRMIQIGDSKTGWAIPYEQWGGSAMEILRTWKGMWTAHNLSYDAKVMAQTTGFEVPWERFHDTMIMHQILFPGARAGLKDCTDKYIDPRASVGQDELKKAFKNNGWDWDTIPIDFPSYWIYSALDPVLAVKLYEYLMPKLKPYHKAYDLELSYRKVATQMETNGMRIDVDYCIEKSEELRVKSEEGKAYFENKFHANLASSQQMVELFRSLGAEFTEFTDSGAPSVNKVQLSVFKKSDNKDVKEAAELIENIKHTDKLRGSYFDNFIHDNVGGVLHPNIRTMGARTHRQSVTNPALQTLPSGETLIRGSFVPHSDDEVLVSCDYSQAELRLLAHFSGDKILIDAFHDADDNGGDFFNSVAQKVYKDPTFDRHADGFKQRGKAIKTLMYGLIYGGQPKTLAAQANIPLDEMQVAYDGLMEEFPGIKQFMDKNINTVERREREEGSGYVILEDGRHLPVDRGKAYQSTNYMLQGTAAYVFKLAVLEMSSAGLDEYMLMPIHDEMILSVPKSKVDEVMPVIEECMSFPDKFAVKFPAEPEVLGDRWVAAYA